MEILRYILIQISFLLIQLLLELQPKMFFFIDSSLFLISSMTNKTAIQN